MLGLQEVDQKKNQGCHVYKSSRTSVPWAYCRRVVQPKRTTLFAVQHHPQRIRIENRPGKTGRI